MRKTPIIGISIVAAILAATLFLIVSSNSNNDASLENNNTPTQTDIEQPTEAEPLSDSYIQYSEESFASASGKRILFFHADWCSQCIALEQDILASDLPSDVTVFEVDYDASQELKEKYGVTIQTTLVSVDQAGKLANKFVAYQDPTWEAVQSNLL